MIPFACQMRHKDHAIYISSLFNSKKLNKHRSIFFFFKEKIFGNMSVSAQTEKKNTKRIYFDLKINN